MNINVVFTRRLLSQIVPAVKAAGHRVTADAWVWKSGRQSWEFQGPGGFYWHGHAYNAYEARYKGWNAYLAKFNPELTTSTDVA